MINAPGTSVVLFGGSWQRDSPLAGGMPHARSEVVAGILLLLCCFLLSLVLWSNLNTCPWGIVLVV